jgi:hypothetical protein
VETKKKLQRAQNWIFDFFLQKKSKIQFCALYPPSCGVTHPQTLFGAAVVVYLGLKAGKIYFFNSSSLGD